jgi:hypothetical protein
VKFPIISSKTKAKKILPKFDKILGCYTVAGAPQPPPTSTLLKANQEYSWPQGRLIEINPPLYTTPMDNIIASAAALANVDPAADNTLEITYANNFINKCIQQQDGFDSHGRVYSRSSGSRAAPTGNQAIVTATAAAPAANLQNCPPLRQVQQQNQPRNNHSAYSSNEPPHHQWYTNDSRYVDTRTHIINNQVWHAK